MPSEKSFFCFDRSQMYCLKTLCATDTSTLQLPDGVAWIWHCHLKTAYIPNPCWKNQEFSSNLISKCCPSKCFFKTGHSWSLFLYCHLLYHTISRYSFVWIRTTDLWCQKRLLYQLSHYYLCPSKCYITSVLSLECFTSRPSFQYQMQYTVLTTTASEGLRSTSTLPTLTLSALEGESARTTASIWTELLGSSKHLDARSLPHFCFLQTFVFLRLFSTW